MCWFVEPENNAESPQYSVRILVFVRYEYVCLNCRYRRTSIEA